MLVCYSHSLLILPPIFRFSHALALIGSFWGPDFVSPRLRGDGGVGAVGAVGVRAGARGEGSPCESGVGRFQLVESYRKLRDRKLLYVC